MKYKFNLCIIFTDKLKFFKNLYHLTKQIPFIKDNTPIANTILFLGIILTFAVIEDFSTELSLDKNEITSLIQILDDTEEDIFFESIIFVINQKNLVSTINFTDVIIESTESFHIFSSRSPPEVC